MIYLIAKYLLTAAVIVLVSEFAKRSDRLGAVLAAMPLVTVLTLIWLYLEHQSSEKIGNHAYYTFWYVLPTLPMFLVFPYCLPRFGFWWSLLGGLSLTGILFVLFALLLKRVGIHLL